MRQKSYITEYKEIWQNVMKRMIKKENNGIERE